MVLERLHLTAAAQALALTAAAQALTLTAAAQALTLTAAAQGLTLVLCCRSDKNKLVMTTAVNECVSTGGAAAMAWPRYKADERMQIAD